jgi:hypothetical protein
MTIPGAQAWLLSRVSRRQLLTGLRDASGNHTVAVPLRFQRGRQFGAPLRAESEAIATGDVHERA